MNLKKKAEQLTRDPAGLERKFRDLFRRNQLFEILDLASFVGQREFKSDETDLRVSRLLNSWVLKAYDAQLPKFSVTQHDLSPKKFRFTTGEKVSYQPPDHSPVKSCVIVDCPYSLFSNMSPEYLVAEEYQVKDFREFLIYFRRMLKHLPNPHPVERIPCSSCFFRDSIQCEVCKGQEWRYPVTREHPLKMYVEATVLIRYYMGRSDWIRSLPPAFYDDRFGNASPSEDLRDFSGTYKVTLDGKVFYEAEPPPGDEVWCPKDLVNDSLLFPRRG